MTSFINQLISSGKETISHCGEGYIADCVFHSLGLIMLELSTRIELPDTGELWEQSRLGDFSCWSQDLSRTSNDIQAFIRWLLTADWQKRPTISQVLQHQQVVEAKANNKNGSQGVLYDYAQQEDLPENTPHRNIYCTPKHKLPLSQEDY